MQALDKSIEHAVRIISFRLQVECRARPRVESGWPPTMECNAQPHMPPLTDGLPGSMYTQCS